MFLMCMLREGWHNSDFVHDVDLFIAFWTWAENTVMGIIRLCIGSIELVMALVRHDNEKKNK